MLNQLNPLSSQEAQKMRLATCFSCPELGTMAITGIAKCKNCGCPIRSKVAVKSATCPLGKW